MTYEQEHGIYGVIYCIKSPSGKMYVGQTTRFKKRMKEYESGKDDDHQPKFFNAIKKYGWKNMRIEVWCHCFDKKDLDERETHIIRLFDLMKNGYNAKGGGANGKMSEESKRKLSIANKGKKLSPEHLQALHNGRIKNKSRIIEMAKKRRHSPETIAKMRQIHKKENLSPEILLKIKLGQLEEKSSQFKPEKFTLKNRITGETFVGNRVEIKRELKLPSNIIYSIIHQKTKSQTGWDVIK